MCCNEHKPSDCSGNEASLREFMPFFTRDETRRTYCAPASMYIALRSEYVLLSFRLGITRTFFTVIFKQPDLSSNAIHGIFIPNNFNPFLYFETSKTDRLVSLEV